MHRLTGLVALVSQLRVARTWSCCTRRAVCRAHGSAAAARGPMGPLFGRRKNKKIKLKITKKKTNRRANRQAR